MIKRAIFPPININYNHQSTSLSTKQQYIVIEGYAGGGRLDERNKNQVKCVAAADMVGAGAEVMGLGLGGLAWTQKLVD
jgi:hypothetical protein